MNDKMIDTHFESTGEQLNNLKKKIGATETIKSSLIQTC